MKDFQLAVPRKFKQPKKIKNTAKHKNNTQEINIVKQSKPYFYNKKVLTDLLLILSFVLICFLLILDYLNQQTILKIKKQQLYSLNYSINLSAYPYISKLTSPNITALSAIITDADSQTILYSKNPNLRFSIASLTKLMTSLVALDYYQAESVLTIYTPRIEGSSLGFEQGEKFRVSDLLYAMLLPSSNEAAFAVSQNYPDGTKNFIRKMNEKARRLYLYNTHFEDPAGLDDDNNYSTVIDMSRLASVIIKNKSLAAITATKEKIITDLSGQKKIKLINRNKLLGIDGVNGIKTGTTDGAGEVLITSKIENGHTYIIIVMKSQQRFIDTKTLLSFISNNIRYITPQFPAALITTDLK